MENNTQVIFERNTVEFVTVAVEYCAFLERSEGMNRTVFVDTTLKILPLLYLKASLIPDCEVQSEDAMENFVSEEDYEVMRLTIASVMGEKDDYLEVFLPDMAYSDTPIKRNISEDVTDIYQDIKDFISIYRLGFDETMQDALAICKENFGIYWGQKLVNTLRALHDVKYNAKDENEDEIEDEMNDLL